MRIATGASPRRDCLLSAIVAMVAMIACLSAPAAPAATPDYALLDDVLLQNVRDGYVDYDGIAANPRFATFLDQLAAAPGDLGSPADELAYYINAYNAFAISGILQGHSPASRLGRSRFYERVEFRLGGATTTLEALERERIRPLADPRAHFALACATLSCPRLWNRAYLPGSLDAQLDAAARRFVNDVTRNRFDIAQRDAFLSRIFDRFRADFEKPGVSVPAYVARYVEEPATRAALVEGRLQVAYLPDDWELNGRYEGAAAR